MRIAPITSEELNADKITAEASTIWEKYNLIKENNFFQGLMDDSMTLDQFRLTQEQFYHAVVFFPRVIAALVARIEDPYQRVGLIKNLVDEHGDLLESETNYHECTIRTFVKHIGGRHTELAGLRIWPEIHAFNNLLMGTCTNDDIKTGISCLGMIEYGFTYISAKIGAEVTRKGWLTGPLTHYCLHEEIDPKHADDFFILVEGDWDDAASRQAIIKGLEQATFLWSSFYSNLWRTAVETA